MTKSETPPEPQEAVEKVSAETVTHEGMPRKLDDLRLDEERRWGLAIRRFVDLKQEEELIGLIESKTDWPDEARTFFVDLIKEDIDRSNGRPGSGRDSHKAEQKASCCRLATCCFG